MSRSLTYEDGIIAERIRVVAKMRALVAKINELASHTGWPEADWIDPDTMSTLIDEIESGV